MGSETRIIGKGKVCPKWFLGKRVSMIMKMLSLLLVVIFAAESAKAVAPQPTQTIRGIVIDNDLRTAIPGATIQVLDSEPSLGCISDANGEFKIPNVEVGRHSLKISSIGYETNTMPDILIISGKEMYLEIKLSQSAEMTEAIVVNDKENITQVNNELITTSVVNLRPEQINRFAGSRSDPSRMAATTAGVAGNNSQRNDIIVRGNSPLGVLWRMEGAEIPNPNHFTMAGNGGGAFAIINNNLLAESDFMTGAFPAEYGNKTAAAFDIRMRNGNNEKHEQTFQAGLNGLELGAEGPISVEGRSSYLASFRYISLKPLTSMGVNLNAEVAPEYMDASFKINLPSETLGNTKIWGIWGNSALIVKESEDEDVIWTDSTTISDHKIRSDMYAAGLNNSHLFSENTLGELIIASCGTLYRAEDIDVYNYKNNSRIDDIYKGIEGWHQVKYNLTHKATPRHLFKAGVDFTYNFYDLEASGFEGDDDEELVLRLKDKGNANLIQSYLHWQYKVTDKLEFNTGLHYQLFTLNDSYAIEPRFSMKYQLDDKRVLSLAYGLHSQTNPIISYFYKVEDDEGNYTTNRDLDFMRSHHLVLGFQNSFGNDFLVKAEAFYQYLYDVPVCTDYDDRYFSYINAGAKYDFDWDYAMANSGEGRNYGIDMTVNKSFANGYYFMVTGSIFKSQYIDGGGQWRSTGFDMGHVLNLLGGIEWNLDESKEYVLSADFKVSHIGGIKAIPYDMEQSILRNKGVLDVSRAYELRLKDYFQLDFKVGLNINTQNTTHNIFIAVDNITNRDNVIEMDWDKDKHAIDYEYQIGLFPYLGYRINF